MRHWGRWVLINSQHCEFFERLQKKKSHFEPYLGFGSTQWGEINSRITIMLSVLCNPYHTCCCVGDFGSWCTSRHGIDPKARNIRPCVRRVNTFLQDNSKLDIRIWYAVYRGVMNYGNTITFPTFCRRRIVSYFESIFNVFPQGPFTKIKPTLVQINDKEKDKKHLNENTRIAMIVRVVYILLAIIWLFDDGMTAATHCSAFSLAH